MFISLSTHWLAIRYLEDRSFIFGGLVFAGCLLLLLPRLIKKFRHMQLLVPSCYVLLLLAVPAYGPDPYADGGGFSSLVPIIVVSLFILDTRKLPRLGGWEINMLLMIAAASVYGFVNSDIFYFLIELKYVFFLVLLLTTASRYNNVQVDNALDALAWWFMGSAILMLALESRGMGVVRSGGGAAYFFGHYWGIGLAFASLRLLTKQMTLRPRVFAVCTLSVSGYLGIVSLQSSHYLLLIASGGLGFLFLSMRAPNVAALLPLAIMSLVVPLIFTTGGSELLQEGSWVALKITQLLALGSGTSELPNSLAVRFAEADALWLQAGIPNILFGSGIGSSYDLQSSQLFDQLVLHSSTFPDAQLTNGSYVFLHEPVLLFSKWFGAVGLLTLLWVMARLWLDADQKYYAALFVLAFFLTFGAGIHTTTLLLVLSSVLRRKSES